MLELQIIGRNFILPMFSQVGSASAIRMRPSLASISFNIEKKRIHGPGLTPLPINFVI
jgi:F-box/leucine-rich repeat protein 2/20